MADRKGIRRVRKALDDAEPVAPPGDAGDGGGAPDGPETPGMADMFALPESGLPGDCPVTALGTADGLWYFVDAIGQLRAVKTSSLGQAEIDGLFAPYSNPYLYDHWPRWSRGEDPKVVGWRAELVREALMKACSLAGVFDPVDSVRGRGAWPAADGGLVMHLGDKIVHVRKDGAQTDHGWGWLGEHIYPRGAALPRPHPDRQDHGERGPGGELAALLSHWRFGRGEVDERLLLGWICAAMLGGALHWRPVCFLIGDRATGKSTLQALLRGLFGRGLLQSENTSAAYIYQTLKQDSLPIALDELEATSDPRRAEAVMDIARIAASGGKFGRGGDNHKSVEFQARSCFLFSAVNAPPLKDTDRSRMAILTLRKLQEGAKPPDVSPLAMAALGARLRRRLLDQWPRWQETLQAYQAALTEAGHDGRGADTFGVLLACADVALHDEPPHSDDLDIWARRLKPEKLAETEDAVANWRRCLEHLLTARVDFFRGGVKYPVAHWLSYWLDPGADVNPDDARQALASVGLAIVSPKGEKDEFLAVANTDSGLRELFDGSIWHGRAGEQGVWAQALRQMPRGTAEKANWMVSQQRIGTVGGRRCTIIRLSALKDLELTEAGPDEAGEEDE